jgi:hypothetical protein
MNTVLFADGCASEVAADAELGTATGLDAEPDACAPPWAG